MADSNKEWQVRMLKDHNQVFLYMDNFTLNSAIQTANNLAAHIPTWRGPFRIQVTEAGEGSPLFELNESHRYFSREELYHTLRLSKICLEGE